jgi:ABC-type glycerol-3-phosphate transport system substrate-binding protein
VLAFVGGFYEMNVKKKFIKNVKKFFLRFLSMVLVCSFIPYIGLGSGEIQSNLLVVQNKKNSLINSYNKYMYLDYINDISKKIKIENQFSPGERSITIDYKDLITSNGIEIKENFEGKNQPIIVWDKKGFCEFVKYIPEDGFYRIKVEYFPLEGTGDTIKRSLSIDGNVPFYEAQTIPFYRYWKPVTYERIVNSVGDEINPQVKEIRNWRVQYVKDTNGNNPDGFDFYLTKGEHKFRFDYIDQGMAISKIILEKVEKEPSYEEYSKQNDKYSMQNKHFVLKIQAEDVYQKNDSTIKREYSGDPASEPFSKSNIVLNYFGGWRWRKGNQEATWEFSVPYSGYYKIGLRFIQNYRDGLISFREILIDDKLLFEELSSYPFRYSREWQFEWLGKSKPYFVYLEKGKHTITFRAVTGKYTQLTVKLDKMAYKLSDLVNKIIMITSSSPDLNFDYELDKKIPNLISDLKEMSSNLEYISSQLTQLNGKRPSIVNEMLSFKDQLQRMIKDPFIIPRQLNDLLNAQTTITNWIEELNNQPLGIDYIIIGDKDATYTARKSNFLQRLYVTWLNFLNSFKKDYDKVAGTKEYKGKKYKTINVWVARGKEWAEVMKRLSDEDFTPKTNIAVNINVVPAGQLSTGSSSALLLSLVSRSYPDVACGVDRLTPVELAIRGATVDLSKLEGFDSVIKRFHEGLLESYKYNNGVYALPETMDFTVMFYRKDIVDKLKVPIPQTWEELYRKVIPVLAQNGMQFYYPTITMNNSGDMFIPFLYQRGGSFYTKDLMRSALDTEKAYMAFKEWTELYTVYKVPVSASFFNRFRTGEMPMGIAGYDMYISLTVAAPELYGRWGIAPIPGHYLNGKLDKSAPAITTADIIMSGTSKVKEAWEFIKWWTSEETQTKFGQEIESTIGPEARWNTANLKAFLRLPWGTGDIEVIQQQWNWYRSQPIVLGGYFTNRHLLNAWTKVVVDNQDLRDSIEKAVKDINKEMQIKQKEYGVVAK